MGDTEGDGISKQPQHQLQPTTPKTQLQEEPSEPHLHQLHLKKPRYEPGQWKQLPSPSPQTQTQTQTQTHNTTTNSSSSSPSPTLSQSQLRKGKYVSPIWKPIEMLWLARAWRVQYQGSSGGVDTITGVGRGKTRAEKDKEVAEFLNLHGVNRDAKTAGTKWDNMLGEFRKVYEWERGSEREQIGKSYFRLSPYERKVHRLPASFDEDVYSELSQFMGHRLRVSQAREEATSLTVTKSLIKEHENPHLSEKIARPLQAIEGVGGRGFESSSSRSVRRIGRIKMTWEESLSLWGEEGEFQRGRVRLQGLNFLDANELTFLDDTMVSCTMEAFEDGPLKGFSVDRFVCGQQVKVFGRRRSSSGLQSDRAQRPLADQPSIRSIPLFEYQDPTEYYLTYLRVPPTTLPNLTELSWFLQEPPAHDLRFPLCKDIYKDLPQGKELFFVTTQLLDCRSIMFDIVGSVVRSNPIITTPAAASRESYIAIWDDCINRVISKFSSHELTFIRRPSLSITDTKKLQDHWPNVTGFVRNFCLWRGDETDQLREGNPDPSLTIGEKILWTFGDLPYILGYYAVGFSITFCALSRSKDRIIQTDLYSLDLSAPADRLRALIPCWRIAGLLSLLSEQCLKLQSYNDFEIIEIESGDIYEHTPNTVKRTFSSKRKWGAVKEIYDLLDQRIPHSEFIINTSEKELALFFKPRGHRAKPTSSEELVEALKFVTKALVALHDLSFMHRDIGWDKMRRSENEWFVIGFDEAVGAPQIYPHPHPHPHGECEGAPEMVRGVHGVKVDVWGVGQLVKTCGLDVVPIGLRELEERCLDQNPDARPTAADCYHHLLELQSSLISSTASGSY